MQRQLSVRTRSADYLRFKRPCWPKPPSCTPAIAESRRLWQEFLPYCEDEIERMYRRLDVQFDHTLGESFYEDRLGPLVDELLDRGVARHSDGAVCIFLEGQKVPMLVRKKDGAFLYGTTDLATIRYRMENWRPDAILYVVDHRQSLHFQQLFAAARLLGYDDVELQHVSFGTVLGDDGRPFKTRSGDTVGLEGLLDEAVRRALEIVAAGDDAKPDGPELSAATAAASRRDGGHCRLEIRRPLAKPHQQLRLQLRQDAGHERQHGHVHAVCLRPGAEHFCQGGGKGDRRSFLRPTLWAVLKSAPVPLSVADSVGLAGRTGAGARTAPLLGSPRIGGGRLSAQPTYGVPFRPGQPLLDVL